MKFSSKNLLLFLSVIAFLGLGFYAVNSGKVSINKSGTSEISTTSEENEDGESSDLETEENKISLEIASPKDGDIVTKSPVVVTGTTVNGADVSVNDADTKADANGKFSVSVPLDEGENEIFVTANDISGNSAESSIKVNLNTE